MPWWRERTKVADPERWLGAGVQHQVIKLYVSVDDAQPMTVVHRSDHLLEQPACVVLGNSSNLQSHG